MTVNIYVPTPSKPIKQESRPKEFHYRLTVWQLLMGYIHPSPHYRISVDMEIHSFQASTSLVISYLMVSIYGWRRNLMEFATIAPKDVLPQVLLEDPDTMAVLRQGDLLRVTILQRESLDYFDRGVESRTFHSFSIRKAAWMSHSGQQNQISY